MILWNLLNYSVSLFLNWNFPALQRVWMSAHMKDHEMLRYDD